MDNEKFKKIKDRYTDFLLWNKDNVDEKICNIASEYAFFQQLYISTSRKKSIVIQEMEELWQGKWKYYKHNFDDNLNNTEIKSFIEKDLDILKMRSTITTHEIYMNFFEECMKNINQLRWDIKSYIDYKKFQAGLH